MPDDTVKFPERPVATVAVSVATITAVVAVVWSLLTAVIGRPSPETPMVFDVGDSVTRATPKSPIVPGVLSATDADFGDSTWFVLDRRGRRVHRISEAGELLGSFGRQGDGPGEFSSPSAIVVHRDQVAVADLDAIHLYDFAGEHAADLRHGSNACLAPRTGDMESVASGLLVLVNCTSPARGVTAMVLLAEDDGSVRLLASIAPPGAGIVADLSFLPVMSAYSGGLLFGNATADCLNVYDWEARPTGRVCHEWLQRLPVSRRQAQAVEDELASVAAAVGARVVVPRQLPPFDRVFDLANGKLAYRILARERQGDPAAGRAPDAVRLRRLVVQDETGGERVLPVPPASAIFVSGEFVLAAWDDPDGVRVATYRLGEL